MGGEVNGVLSPSASVLVYDAEADTWATGPPLPTALRSCRAVTIDGGIVLIGPGSLLKYENAAWSVLAGGGHAVDVACGSVILG